MSDQTPDVELATSVQGEMETADIVQEYELEAPPEKVWRAITIPTFRERWLPDHDLAQAEPVAVIPNEEILFQGCSWYCFVSGKICYTSCAKDIFINKKSACAL